MKPRAGSRTFGIQELSRAAGYRSYTSITHAFQGSRQLPLDRAIRIAQYMGISVEELHRQIQYWTNQYKKTASPKQLLIRYIAERRRNNARIAS